MTSIVQGVVELVHDLVRLPEPILHDKAEAAQHELPRAEI